MSSLALAGAVLLCDCTDEAEPDGGAREFVVRVANLTPSRSLYETGRFDIPDAELSPGPIEPGQSYRFDVDVHPGMQLQIFTMFAESNDAFLAFAPGGIALWDHDGEPLVGDRTAELVLYDAGTEHNEALGQGPSQPLRQTEAGAGEDEDGVVTVIADAQAGASVGPDGVKFPAISDFVELHLIQLDDTRFRVVISNVSSKSLLGKPDDGPSDPKPALLAPGVYTVHAAGVEWFEIGEPASAQLERLVEDADPQPIASLFGYLRGIASDLSGVVWAIHEGDTSLCDLGMPASAGLEQLVEDGRSERLVEELGEDPSIRVVGVADRRNGSPVIEPGEAVEFRVWAEPGAQLGLVTGYLAANDKFVGVCEGGIPLFDRNGVPRSGDLDWAVALYDAGTEVDEPPGLGAHQFERQSRTGTGADEHALVREVRGPWMGWDYPLAEQIISVELEVSSAEPLAPDDGIPNFP